MQCTSHDPIFGIVAGEISGDILGADLIKALSVQFPRARFLGIGGSHMEQEGFEALFGIEQLSVFGGWEILKQLPRILSIEKKIFQYFCAHPPDVFIGIDYPEFNFRLAKKLKKNGVLTVHYSSPSIMAWRRGRVEKIKKAIHHMFAFYPPEKKIYEEYGVPVTCVGHPLASKIPLKTDDSIQAKKKLGYSEHDIVIGVLPGSRNSEISRLAPPFFQAMVCIKKAYSNAKFIIPAANESFFVQLKEMQKQYPQVDVTVILGESQRVMHASDILILACGTATLEAMFYKKPMVVSYKLAVISGWLAHLFIYIPWLSLPNILANKMVVPELYQRDVTPEKITHHIISLLSDPQKVYEMKKEFLLCHKKLKFNVSTTTKTAQKIAQLISHHNKKVTCDIQH